MSERPSNIISFPSGKNLDENDPHGEEKAKKTRGGGEESKSPDIEINAPEIMGQAEDEAEKLFEKSKFEEEK